MIEKLEGKVGEEGIEMSYSGETDLQGKYVSESQGNYGVPKLDASMAMRYYGVFV